MRRVVYLAVAIVVVLLVWAVLPGETNVERALDAPSSAVAAQTDAEDDVAALGADDSHSVVARPAPTTRVEARASKPAASSFGPPGELVVQVVDDESGEPISNATVTLSETRVKQGSIRGASIAHVSFSEGGAPLRATSDERGEARLPFPSRLANQVTDEASLRVEHIDHVSLEATVPLTGVSSRANVRLQPNAVVVVSGWIDTPSNVVHDITVRVSDGTGVATNAWRTTADGRTSARFPRPGEHALTLVWRSLIDETFESDVVAFRVGPGQTKEVSVELHPHVALSGRLDDSVPRPVANGEIAVNVDFGGGTTPTALRVERAKIEPDGSFHFASLPRGRAQYVALCDGWVTIDVPETYRRVGTGANDSARGRSAGTALEPVQRPSTLIHPFLTLPLAGAFVVPMQPTATLEMDVVDRADAPIEGARVELSPKIRWRTLGSSPWFERKWQARTDARGRVRLENLPPSRSVVVRVSAPGWTLRDDDGDPTSRILVDLVSGETAVRDALLSVDER